MYNDSFKLRYKTIPVAISETNTFFPTKPHNHNEIEILLILKGKSEVRINSKVFAARQGDLIFVNPLEVHSHLAERVGDYCHRCICFETSVIADSFLAKNINDGKLMLPHFIKSNNPLNKKLSDGFNKVYEAVEKDSQTLNLEVVSYLNLMFADMINNSLLIQNFKANENTAFCDRVIKYIAENYSENITSKQAAEELSFNQSYFCRAFKKNFGISFSSYLNMYRISASKKLIENSGENIADIAFKCGFSNPDYFTKCFKSFLGISPSEYKKSI